MVWAPKVPSVP